MLGSRDSSAPRPASGAGTADWLGNTPAPRNSASVIVDSRNRRAVLFGGGQGSRSFNDLWEMPLGALAGYSWLPLRSSGTPPPARWGHCAVYDPAGERMIVFGGKSVGVQVNDTWELRLTDNSWHRLFPSGTPPAPRLAPQGVYHPGRRSLVLFGGTDLGRPLGDLWELELDSLSWRPIAASGEQPPARWGGATAYDAATDSMLLVAGITGGFLNDAWLLGLEPDRERWTRLEPSGTPPSARGDCGGCFVADQRRLYLFAGWVYLDETFGLHNDLHVLELDGPSWRRLAPVGGAPASRRCAAGFFDPQARNACFFGGQVHDGWDNLSALAETAYFPVDAAPAAEWHDVPAVSAPLLQVIPLPGGPVRIRYLIPRDGTATLSIATADGRAVCGLSAGPLQPPWGWLVWNGCDDEGHPVPAGSYRCLLRLADTCVSRLFTLTE